MSEKPKSKLLKYLPAIYQENAFLEEFLLAFERIIYSGWKFDGTEKKEVAGFDAILNKIDRYFIPGFKEDAQGLPDTEFLSWLAQWVALELDEQWPVQKRIENIGNAVDLYLWRGTKKGLMDYIRIYTGQEPEIRECCWPAGMQIGVASMIGGLTPKTEFGEFSAERQPQASCDYYVIREYDAPGTVYYYRADMVRKVDVDMANRQVTVSYLSPDSGDVREELHMNATASRRDNLADTRYLLTGLPKGGVEQVTADYAGDTVLIGEEKDIPYRFIVDLKVDADVEKIKAIVDLEKPAHTLYYLSLTPERTGKGFDPMQIKVLSTIGIDTIVG